MSKSLVVIVYSPGQARRRTVIVPDRRDPDDWDQRCLPFHTQNIARGEAVLVGTLADYRYYGPDAMLARYLGRKPLTDRYAIINHAGYVVGITPGDSLIDRSQAGRLHRDPAGVAVIGQQCKNLSLLP